MLLNALAIEMRHRGGHAVDAAERSQIVDVEEQAPIARPAQLVQPDQPRFDIGTIGVRRAPQRRRARRRFAQLAARLLGVLIEASQLRDFQLAFDFELPQLDEQLAFLRRELFASRCSADPLGGACAGWVFAETGVRAASVRSAATVAR